MTNLAALYIEKGDQEAALQLHVNGLAIEEQAFGPGSPQMSNFLKNYAAFLRGVGLVEWAAEQEKRVY